MEKIKSVPQKAEKLKEPRDYKVILLNDNYTTMDFVVDILIAVFHKNKIEANRIMMDVHRKGKGVVGRYSFDIARTKVEQVHYLARQAEFPLKCIMEEV
jgi:ATP-dependent Clp protease adaptor protein ClpS